jgi:hypothetical protein
MKFKDIIIRYLLVILLGFLVFYIDSFEFLENTFTKLLILTLVLFKCLFFFIQSFKKILEATRNDVAYYHFLVFMAINIALIILSFGVDFLCLYQVEPSSFLGINPTISFERKVFELFYFSLLNFSNFGYGEILPVSLTCKVLVMIEILISFVTIIFVLSDFVSLKESFANKNFDFQIGKRKK